MAVFYPVTRLASMLSAALSGWLAGSVLRDVGGSLGGLRFGPVDTIIAASGLIVLLAGVFAMAALPDTGAGKAAARAGEDTAAPADQADPADPADPAGQADPAAKERQDAEVVAHHDDGELSARATDRSDDPRPTDG